MVMFLDFFAFLTCGSYEPTETTASFDPAKIGLRGQAYLTRVDTDRN